MEQDEPVAGFYAPVHRSLTEPILLGGAPRAVAILNGTLAAAIGLSVAALALIVLINVLEIVSRTFFHVSFAWIYETNLLLAAWTYFLGIVPVYARNGDVSVVGLKQLLPSGARLSVHPWIHSDSSIVTGTSAR